MPPRPRRRRHRTPRHRPFHDAVESLRDRFPDRAVYWTVTSPGRSEWFSSTPALATPAYRELGVVHTTRAPTPGQLANHTAFHEALAAGAQAAMNLETAPDHDPTLDRLRAELAPLVRETIIRQMCRRSGLAL